MAVDCFSSYIHHFKIAHDVSLDNISCLSDDNNDVEVPDLASSSSTTSAGTTEPPSVNYLEHSFSVNLKNATNLLKGTGIVDLDLDEISPIGLKIPRSGSLRIEDVEKLDLGINQLDSEEARTQRSNDDIIVERQSYDLTKKTLDDVGTRATPDTTGIGLRSRPSTSGDFTNPDGKSWGETESAHHHEGVPHQGSLKRGEDDDVFDTECSRRRSTSSEEGASVASTPPTGWAGAGTPPAGTAGCGAAGTQRPGNIKRRRRPRKLPEIPTHSQRKNVTTVPLSALVNFQSLADEIQLADPSSNFNINQSASTTAWRYGISHKDPNGINWRELGSPENIEPPLKLETDCEHFMHAVLSPGSRTQPAGCLTKSPDYSYPLPYCPVKTPEDKVYPSPKELKDKQDQVQAVVHQDQVQAVADQVQSPPKCYDQVQSSVCKVQSPVYEQQPSYYHDQVRLPDHEVQCYGDKVQSPDVRQDEVQSSSFKETSPSFREVSSSSSKPLSLSCKMPAAPDYYYTMSLETQTRSQTMRRSNYASSPHVRGGEFCESAEYFDDEPRRHKSSLMSHLDDSIDLNLNTTATEHRACLSSDNHYLQTDSSPEDMASGRRQSDQGPGRGGGNSGQRGAERQPSSSTSSPSEELGDLEPTHRGCHKFIPRHDDEMFIEIGHPIYVDDEADDLWCEGINLKTGKRGIFPAAYATDLSMLEDGRQSKYILKFLGSVEVNYHKGNDVLCQAMHKVATSRRLTMNTQPPPRYCLEVTEYGIKMTDKSRKKKDKNRPEPAKNSTAAAIRQRLAKILSKNREAAPTDHFFSLKNVSFCGCHPKNDKYFAFITKHPLEMRFACHVFMGDKSTRVIAEVVGESFRKFYQEYMAFVHPTEDIYLE